MAGASQGEVATTGVAENNGVVVVSESSPPPQADVESVRRKLRQRWELASVLNFLHVFEPLIGSDLKISAEDVETALIEQNRTLARLHITLLKGILPERKRLKSSDEWMIALTNTLSSWWHWVAEGDFPLTGAKGEQISTYKKLEPTTRLLILKALCEVRADQYDASSYVTEAIKIGTEISHFRKDKIAGDGNGTAFWYDGDETIGHRLYKEVQFFENKGVKGKSSVLAVNSEWEALATNLEEFNKIVNDFSSSEVESEVALRKYVETDVIPILEKQQKKKQRALLRQERQERLLNGFRHSRITRSCRNHKPIDYRYDDYDTAITEATQTTKRQKTSEEQRLEVKPTREKRKRTTSNGSDNSDSTRDAESTESDDEGSNREERDDTDDSSQEEYDWEKEDDGNKGTCGYLGEVDSHAQNKLSAHRSRGLRFSKRLAGIPGHTVSERMNIGAKSRLRQRPSVNTTAESMVVSVNTGR